MADDYEYEPFDPNTLSPEDLKEWEQAEELNAQWEHESWLARLRGQGLSANLDEIHQNLLLDAIRDTWYELDMVRGDPVAFDAWLKRRAKWKLPMRQVNTASRAALKQLDALVSKVEALGRLDAVHTRVCKDFLERCAEARRILKPIGLPRLKKIQTNPDDFA